MGWGYLVGFLIPVYVPWRSITEGLGVLKFIGIFGMDMGKLFCTGAKDIHIPNKATTRHVVIIKIARHFRRMVILETLFHILSAGADFPIV